MPRDIIAELSVIAELRKQNMLPIVKDVIMGYNFRFNQLKGVSNVNPKYVQVAELVEADVMLSWNFASLGNNVVSHQRVHQILKEYLDRLSKLKAQPQNRRNSPY